LSSYFSFNTLALAICTFFNFNFLAANYAILSFKLDFYANLAFFAFSISYYNLEDLTIVSYLTGAAGNILGVSGYIG